MYYLILNDRLASLTLVWALMDLYVGRSGRPWWFPWSRLGLPGISQGYRISVSPIPVHLPSRLEDGYVRWVFDNVCRSVSLDVWVSRFPRSDVTSGGMTWPALMRVFSERKRCGPLDPEDLTVEINSMFRILRSLGLINSGLNSAETLHFSFVSCLIAEHSLAHSSENRVISRPLP